MKENSYKYRGYYCINSNTRNINPLLSNNLKKLSSDLYQICKDYNSANFYWYIVDNEGKQITCGQQIYNTYRRLTKQDLIVF